jgi:hypothetical protein
MAMGEKHSGRGVRIGPLQAIGEEFFVVVWHRLPKPLHSPTRLAISVNIRKP